MDSFNDNDGDEVFCEMVSKWMGFKPYFLLGPLLEVLTIATLQCTKQDLKLPRI